uniref:SER_THR_PHOSPHATASE domain-containing protein n=1 Tax=Heterorhabditis bacteriophora TaxID=37862 RepID=A0A1I7WNH2_HETBA
MKYEDKIIEFKQVRLVSDEEDRSNNASPMLIIVILFILSFIPLMNSHLEERRKHSQKRAEKAPSIDDLKMDIPLKEVYECIYVSPNFPSLKKLQETLRTFNYAYRFVVNGSMEERDIVLISEVKTVEQDDVVTKKVIRTAPTKYNSLLMKLVEHGPYEFEFDPIEVETSQIKRRIERAMFIGNLFDCVAQLLAHEPSLLELSGDILIYGNLEGNYAKILFLGGFTSDGQPYSLETITLLFALKKQMPNHVYLLRGITEVYPMNLEVVIIDSYIKRFSYRVAQCLENVIQRACGYLPLAAVVADTIFCSHGGIGTRVQKLDQIRDIRRPLHHLKRGTIAADLIFSTVSNTNGSIPGARGHSFNPLSLETEQTLQLLGMEMFFRSRNPVKNGFHVFGIRLISIWSAPGESKCKAGAAIKVGSDKSISIIKMTEYGTLKHSAFESRFKLFMHLIYYISETD